MDNDIKGYPKFQWSVFTRNGKDEQFVIRADTWEDLEFGKTKVLAELGKKTLEERTSTPQYTTNVSEAFDQPKPGMPDTIPTDLGICTKCNVGKNVYNPKTGKIFCERKCWLNKP